MLDIVELSEARVDRVHMATWSGSRGSWWRAGVTMSKAQLYDLLYGDHPSSPIITYQPLPVYLDFSLPYYVPSLQRLGWPHLFPILCYFSIRSALLLSPHRTQLAAAAPPGDGYMSVRDATVIVLIAITSSVVVMTKYSTFSYLAQRYILPKAESGYPAARQPTKNAFSLAGESSPGP